MSVYSRGESWYYEFVVRGVRYRGAIGNVTKKVAREVADKKRVAALEGKLVQRAPKSPLLGHWVAEKKIFTDGAGEYYKYCATNHKPTSLRRIETSLLQLCKSFGNHRLSEIDPFMIEKYKTQRKSEGRADGTVNRELSCLKNLFNKGNQWGWVRDNPVRQVKMFRENNARQRFVTLEEEKRLLEACNKEGRIRMATFVVAALDTGFRYSELASVRWKDVDFERGDISVASCYTKNGEPRRNPMTKRLKEMLTLMRGTGTPQIDATVFGPYRYSKAFWKARDAAGLGKDVCFHTLRHTFISRLVMGGVDLRTTQEMAGHKEIKMTMRYAHLAPEQKRRAIGVLDNQVPTNFPTATPEAVVSACAPVAQLDRAAVS